MKEESSLLKDELKRIDTQIKAHKYGGKLENITKLWEARKDIVNEVGKEISKEESSFLKGELEKIDSKIKAYGYGRKENVNKKRELFKLRKIIVEEIKIIKAKRPQVVGFLPRKRDVQRVIDEYEEED